MQRRRLPDPDGRLPQNFPMGVHPNGQFYKKRLGRPWYFGAVKHGWRAALEQFNHDWPYILAGRVPPDVTAQVGGPDPSSLEFVATQFVAREKRRLDRGQISGGSFTDIRNAVEISVTHLGKTTKIRTLLPDDFADLRDSLSYKWVKEGEGESVRWVKTTDRVGPAVLKRRIIHVRAMFNWAGPEKQKLIETPPNYGDEFPIVSDATIQRALNNRERKHGAKRWEVSEILSIYNALDEQLQAMFLLSLNCAFTAADCAALPWRSVYLDRGYIDFARVKTGVDRLRLWLWPETIAALKHVQALKLSPAPGFADAVVHQARGDNGEAIGDPVLLKDCVFITSRGRPWVERKVKLDAQKLPTSESHKDSVALEFNKVLKRLKIKRKGVGFSAGRHTFESHGLRVADKELVNAVMGHTDGSMAERYDHAIDDDLKALVMGVRERVWLNAQQGNKPTGGASPTTPRLAG